MSFKVDGINWPERLGAIAIALMTLAIGLCFFDGDHFGQDSYSALPDLCMGLVTALFGVILLGLTEIARLSSNPVRSIYTTSLHHPDPPPKTLVLLV